MEERPHSTSEWAEVKGSSVHGRGMFAVKDIPEGESIIEYLGERIDKEESDRRGNAFPQIFNYRFPFRDILNCKHTSTMNTRTFNFGPFRC
jgi:hypothetical protein